MDWADMLQRFGFPVVVCLVLCYAIFKVVCWIGAEVVKPMVKAHLDFLSSVRGFLEETKVMIKTHERLTITTSEQMKLLSEAMVQIQNEFKAWAKSNQSPTSSGKSSAS